MVPTVDLHPRVELADGTSVLLRKITFNNFMWTPNPVTNMEMNTCLHRALKLIRLKVKSVINRMSKGNLYGKPKTIQQYD
jgi:hypothetical protein